MQDLQQETLLLCLPFAGAGASFFRAWRGAPPGLRIDPVQLPGREGRFREEPLRSMRAVVDDAFASTIERGGGQAVALFGHSLGAVLAFELALRYIEEGHEVTRLFVSGSPTPWKPRALRATGLVDDNAFIRKVNEFAGYSHPALEDPEMRELLLPTLRADVALYEDSYRLKPVRLPVPVTAIRGTHDELVGQAQCLAWAEATSVGLRVAEVPGGHMYLADTSSELLKLVSEHLHDDLSPNMESERQACSPATSSGWTNPVHPSP